LFDDLRAMDAHPYGNAERELLEYAAIAHDIGTFISHTNHAKHACYLIRNSDLLGFNDTEIDIMANVAYYHRRGIPKKRHENTADLGRDEREQVSLLAGILRLAEGLDRGHRGAVKDVHLERFRNPRRFVLTMLCDDDCEFEVWGVENNKDLFEYVFSTPLDVAVESTADSSAAMREAGAA
jgi:exopolyphosphatase/guanosine-5'-triphosphate,3'-diphosphate pyrophosphatase